MIATKWVTEEECDAGYWMYYSILVLGNMRGGTCYAIEPGMQLR